MEKDHKRTKGAEKDPNPDKGVCQGTKGADGRTITDRELAGSTYVKEQRVLKRILARTRLVRSKGELKYDTSNPTTKGRVRWLGDSH